MFLLSILAILLSVTVNAINFNWERDQLTEGEVVTNSALRFGGSDSRPLKQCKSIPGDDDWPSDEDWSTFNATLGGVLLKPKPLANVCYAGQNYDQQRCDQLKQSWAGMNLQ
jgi:hypothetical protein